MIAKYVLRASFTCLVCSSICLSIYHTLSANFNTVRTHRCQVGLVYLILTVYVFIHHAVSHDGLEEVHGLPPQRDNDGSQISSGEVFDV